MNSNAIISWLFFVASGFTWPNGLAFSADFTKLYLAVASPKDPAWYVYDVAEDGSLSNRRLFLDAKPMKKVANAWAS